MAEIKTYKLRNLPSSPQPNSVYWTQPTTSSPVIGYITDINGVPYPLRDLTGSGGITGISNTDGYITVTGVSNKVINLDAALVSTINSALQSGDLISSLINDAGYITLSDLPIFDPLDYDLDEFNNVSSDPYARQSELTSGVTNLAYTPSPTQGTVTSDTGTDAVIPLANGVNAGLSFNDFTSALKMAYDTTYSWVITNGANVLSHIVNVSNPHNVTKSQVGLGNVQDADTTTTANITDSTNKRFQTDNQNTNNDATSPIQGQLNSKVNHNRYAFQGKTSITGVTGEQDICSFKIPAGAYSNTADAFKFDFTPIKSVTASSSTFKIYIGTTANARTNVIAQALLTTTGRAGDVTRRYSIDSSTIDTSVAFASNASSGLSVSTTANTPIAVNMANDLWITITANPTASGESHGVMMASITPLK